ncbi:MAG TPA: hypothetical protein VMT64_10510 [Candidatus Binataceae bacterium]|nr:hypothetical protein [Candidatus Binataceae bacterium]
MPTRPVTWDLDVPPENLLEPAKQAPPPGDPPNIDKFRALLTGTRFELVKIATFAAFLFSFVAIAVHGSHLTNPDNPFVADTNAAFKDLASEVSKQTHAIGEGTEALALAASHQAEVAIGRVDSPGAPVTVAASGVPVHGKQAARSESSTHPAQARVAMLDANPVHPAHHGHHSVEVASDQVSHPRWSGSLLDLPNLISTEGNRAGRKLLDAMTGKFEPDTVAAAHRGKRVAPQVHKHMTVKQTSPSQQSPSFFQGLIAPDSLLAAMAALVLYLIFVVILVQIRGGLRAFADNQAAV